MLNLNKKEIVAIYEKLNGTLVMNGEPVITDIYEFEKKFFESEETLDSLFQLYGDATVVAYRKFKQDKLENGVSIAEIEKMYQDERNYNWLKAKSFIDNKKFSYYVFEHIIAPKVVGHMEEHSQSKIKVDHSKAVEPTNLTKEDYKAMIDFALQTGDKDWFDELIGKMQTA
jgi:hypothetical protein